MEYSSYKGKILYLGDTVGERGREWFTVTKHPGGLRTIRAMCEIDDTEVLRDVIYTANSKWQPIDAFIRLTVAGKFMGSGWFRFSDQLAECETFMADVGRVSQRLTLNQPPPFFGVHPVACDCWCLGGFDHTSGAAVQVLRQGMMSSLLSNGASGPMLHSFDLTIEYLGEQEVTVPAGTFQTNHYRFLLDDRPAEELWCFGEDLIFVKIRWEHLATTYVLTELEGISH